MKKILLAFVMMTGMAFASYPQIEQHPRRVVTTTVVKPAPRPAPPRPIRVENRRYVNHPWPFYVRPATHIYTTTRYEEPKTKITLCHIKTGKCDTYINPTYEIYYDEIVVKTKSGATIVYDTDEYNIDIIE